MPLSLAREIWNCVIFADVLRDSKYLDALYRAASETKGPVSLIDAMVSRKRERYGDDERLIGPWSLPMRRSRRPVLPSILNP